VMAGHNNDRVNACDKSLIMVSPSILSANFADLGAQVRLWFCGLEVAGHVAEQVGSRSPLEKLRQLEATGNQKRTR
jgi:hypothetical protein